MPEYTCRLQSQTTDGRIEATLDLRVLDATDRDEAHALVRSALPGAGWAAWVTTWGVVETKESDDA